MAFSMSYWSERRLFRKRANEDVAASLADSRAIAVNMMAQESGNNEEKQNAISSNFRKENMGSAISMFLSESLKSADLQTASLETMSEESMSHKDTRPPVYVASGGSVADKSVVTVVEEEKEEEEDKEEDENWHDFLESVEQRDTADEFSDAEEEVLEDVTAPTKLAMELLLWATSYGITLAALSALLFILRFFHPDLPKDARTLLKTPRNTNVKPLANGSYFHFGIFHCLSKSKSLINFLSGCLPGVPVISLQINIDGLPISKSGSKQLWPILARVCEPICGEPFMVGLFCGDNKPDTIDEYMDDFIREVETFQRGPANFDLNGRLQPAQIVLSCFVCDTPARSYVKQTKGHCGYFACERCTQKGSYTEGKVVFDDINAPDRTDAAFNEQRQPEHHNGISPLLHLAINMISQFPLDPMHLLHLGVVRRLLIFLVKSPVSKGIRLAQNSIRQISQSLDSFREYIPREFSRRCRNLSELDRWKATEFRQFLLYSGIVALRGQLPEEYYDHFLLLYVAAFCLSNERLWQSHADYAKRRLRSFVDKARQLYGSEFLVYNVHSLIHIADDVKRYGPLDSYSAYPFENYLGQLKRLLRKPGLPLQQIIRRVLERDGMFTTQRKECLPHDVPRKEHIRGPIPVGIADCLQFQDISFNGLFFSVSKGNNCVRKGGRFYLIRNILAVEGDDGHIFVLERFLITRSFFDYPCSSLDFHIVRASRLAGFTETAYVHETDQKCVMLPYKNEEYVLIPLLEFKQH